MKKLLLVSALALLITCTFGFTRQPAAAVWEYKISTQLETNDDKTEAEMLSISGLHGWEVFAVEPTAHGHRYFFKRQK